MKTTRQQDYEDNDITRLEGNKTTTSQDNKTMNITRLQNNKAKRQKDYKIGTPQDNNITRLQHWKTTRQHHRHKTTRLQDYNNYNII